MIQEIIIISNTGIPLFNYTLERSSNNKYDYRVIASYFDQICRFTKYRFKESLVTLIMDKSEFYFYTHPEKLCHLIIKIDNEKLKKESIDQLAWEIFNRFVLKYKKNLIDFKGNINIFKPFSKNIEKLLRSEKIKSLLITSL